MESNEKQIRYPIVGISSVGMGILITQLSIFSIHSLEGIIWALVMLGLGFILPAFMFIQSIKLLASKQSGEKIKFQ